MTCRMASGLKFLVSIPFFVFLCAVNTASGFDENSSIDLKLGLGSFVHPHYFGSNHSYRATLPGGWLVTDFMELAGKNRVYFYRNDHIVVDVTFSARVPITSAELNEDTPVGLQDANAEIFSRRNYTRRGMPDLEPILFPGINLKWDVADFFMIEAPVFTGIELGGNFRSVGLTFSPDFIIKPFRNKTNWENHISLIINPLFAGRTYNQYYYEVSPEFALSDRPEYTASGGLTLITYGLKTLWNIGEWWFAFNFYIHDMRSSVVSDSPLVVSPHSYSLSMMITRNYYKGTIAEITE